MTQHAMDKASVYTSVRILTIPVLTLYLKSMAFKMVVIGITLNNIAIIYKSNFSYTVNKRYRWYLLRAIQ